MSLVLTIHSFSYKKGIPPDLSGNGGGFVFDCRVVKNPGRIEHYKTLSGIDTLIIQYLDSLEEMQSFMHHVESLINMSIRNYLERGFEHLQVSFGCTGGQHRSVYAAEKLKKFVTNAYPEVIISLKHTNRENWVGKM